MKLEALAKKIKAGEIDTVALAFPDPLGRLVGKRFTGRYFLEHAAAHGTHACNYLLAVNIEMDPLEGFALANWEKGFGDFVMTPDWSTLRPLPWQPGSALAICDYARDDGAPVAESPRAVLRRQIGRLRERGWECAAASELEFFLFQQSYHEAFGAQYRRLTPSSDYRIDYHLMQPTRDEPLMRAVRNAMEGAGIPVECSKGEWGCGQHEINFAYGAPLETADRHALFKQGVKEIAAQHGKAISFMAKWRANEVGSSCHIHLSLWRGGKNIFQNVRAAGGSRIFRQFLGGCLRYAPELSYFFAPTVNSYKRYQPGSWAPTRMAWARDNRTVGFRVVGEGKSFRIENRMPGADANPYLAFAAMIAAGLAGVEEGLDCGPEYSGNAYADESLARLPASLRDAADLLEKSALARRVFGGAVVDFYVHTARCEWQAFQDAVTDWERFRYFERI